MVPVLIPVDGDRFRAGFSWGLGWHVAAAIIGAIIFIARIVFANMFRVSHASTAIGTLMQARMFV